MKIRRHDYNSMEEFEAYKNALIEGDADSTEINVVDVVREERPNGKWMCVDLMTECKRAKTSARRLFSVLTWEEIHEELNWRLEDVEELIDNGYFELYEENEFSFGCEEVGECGLWYIHLNVRTVPSDEEVEEAVAEAVAEEVEQTPTETDTQSDLERCCKGIRDTLEAVYNGEMIADEDGYIDGIDCGLCEGDAVSMWDWFTTGFDAYDIAYTIGSDGAYRGVRLMVACGGPNIYIDTIRGEVVGYWWTDTATAWIPSEICKEIDGVWEEYYAMMVG